MKKLITLVFVTAFIFNVFSVFYSFADETITLTTYYPAPYGIYKELRADGMAIGSTYRHTPSSLTNGYLVVSERLGIGTASPQYTLHVDGQVKIEDTLEVSGDSHFGDYVIIDGNVGIGIANPQATLDVIGMMEHNNHKVVTWARATDIDSCNDACSPNSCILAINQGNIVSCSYTHGSYDTTCFCK